MDILIIIFFFHDYFFLLGLLYINKIKIYF